MVYYTTSTRIRNEMKRDGDGHCIDLTKSQAEKKPSLQDGM